MLSLEELAPGSAITRSWGYRFTAGPGKIGASPGAATAAAAAACGWPCDCLRLRCCGKVGIILGSQAGGGMFH